ncbi:MAG: UMP kinase [Fervidicoccaceae archaeon]
MEKRTPIVIKISGSFIQPDMPEMVKQYAGLLREIWESGYRPMVVVGGGRIARLYIESARSLGASESMLDLLGIDVTRLNAHLLITSLADIALPYPPRNIDEILNAKQDPLERIMVAGGLQPGQSTNAVSAVVAELVGAKKIINATKVDGVYDRDPNIDKNAKLIRKITTMQMREILEKQSALAGKYELLDPPSLTIIERSKIIVHVISGSDPQNVLKVLRGEELGSVILPV